MTIEQIQKDLNKVTKKAERVEAIKQNKPRIRNGYPSNNEGNDGDEQICLTTKGLRLYKKFRNKWYYVSLVSD